MRGDILDVSNICVDFIHDEGSFMHQAEGLRVGKDGGVLAAVELLAHYRMELNKFFLDETLSNKSFPISPMNRLAVSLID